jgi:alpha-ketoglutarate-dependent taurine dioxygenase
MDLFDNNVKCEFIKTLDNKVAETLLVIKPDNKEFNPIEWLKENKLKIETCLHRFGGILFREFGLYSVSEFNKVVQSICPNLLDYVYRSTPRTKLGGKIYTATEYPSDRVIPMHNENSYSKSWPEKIFFFSVINASEGGETPIADSRKVYNKIDKTIREKFEQKGVLYVRNYTRGIDLGWQEVFQTDNKEEVNEFCKNHDIEAIWNNHGPELTTKQICQSTYVHPVTKDSVWFNQAHLFHSSALEDKDRLSLIQELGEENLPRNTFYGDGEQIEPHVLEHIRNIYEGAKIKFKWQKGDILMLDNVLTAHGRETYKGERKIAVAMA